MKTIRIKYWTLFVILTIMSCTNNDVFLKYKTIDIKGWNKDSVCGFDIPVSDTSSIYNLYVNIRNRGEYPYQNLWLFLQKTSPDSTISKDSINLFLADQYGKWLGSGVGPVFEMPVLYQQDYKFHQTGTYHYQIGQGMRDSVLVGINDIGIRLEKVKANQ